MPPDKRLRTEEGQFLAEYMDWLDQGGYDLHFHVIDSRRPAKVTSRGYPDVHASHPTRGLLIAELKSSTGRPSQTQWKWLTRLATQLPPPPDDTAMGRVHLWKPKDRLKPLTQIGIQPGPPVPCDCPVCRYLAGESNPLRRRHTTRQQVEQEKCPVCRRQMDPETAVTTGTCGRCTNRDRENFEADLIRERIMEKVY